MAVSLQGTFDVLALADLLRMLAGSRKSGELLIESGGVAGRLEFHEGACSAVESTDVRGAATDEDDLRRRALEVAFSIARRPGGSFRFAASEGVRDISFAVVVEPLLAELELMQVEWEEICEVVPSTDLRPRLVAELQGDDVVISAPEWRLLARMDGYTPVNDLVDTSRETLVDVCRAVAELVRRGAIELHEADTLASRPDADDSGNQSEGQGGGEVPYYGARIVPVAPYGPGVDEPEAAAASQPAPVTTAEVEAEPVTADVAAFVAGAEPVATARPSDVDAGADPRDRGAILRLFSGLREA